MVYLPAVSLVNLLKQELSYQPNPVKLHHAALCMAISTCILQMLNTHQSALHLLQSYIYHNIVPSYTSLQKPKKAGMQIARGSYKLSWQKVMLESLCNTGCICSGVVRGHDYAKKVSHYI